MRALFVLATIFMPVAFAVGQQTNTNACPTLRVDGPSGAVKPGEIETYTAKVDPQGSNITPVYKWTVSKGTIVSGQGTEKIDVRNPAGWTTTAQVEVQGLPLGCPNVASETVADLYGNEIVARKIAQFFGPLTKTNFDGLVNAAKQEPNSQVFVTLSGPAHRPAQSIAAKRTLIVSKLGSRLGEITRITFINSTKKDDRATFWLVPPGATPPLP